MTRGLPQRPAAVVLDGLVYRRHQADGLGEGGDDALVVNLIVVAEGAAPAVFEPLFADLIAADVELPHLRRDAVEVLRRVDVDAARLPIRRSVYATSRLAYLAACWGRRLAA